MQVIDCLPPITALVGDQPIARFSYTLELRHFRTHGKEMSQEGFLAGPQVVDRCDMPLGNHECVDGSLRIDIVEGERMLVFMHDLGWNLFVDNLTEETIAHNNLLLLS